MKDRPMYKEQNIVKYKSKFRSKLNKSKLNCFDYGKLRYYKKMFKNRKEDSNKDRG